MLPSRNARHGTLSLCRRHSRAFLHHLFRCGEITGKVLATEHNVRFFLDFMAGLRRAIAAGRLADVGGDGGPEAERR